VYEAFFGFREKPFSILPDPGFLYLSPKHSMALAVLEYGLSNQAGFNVITGDIGTGKTTLIRHLLNQMGEDVTIGLISNTHRSFGELLQWILFAFKLEHRGKEKVEMFRDFIDFLVKEYSGNHRTVLIVDEAQNLSPAALEELRMLSNVNADKDQLLQLVLVGQAELRETLRRPDLVQFAQRVAVDYHLAPLTREETHAYIRHRIAVAGCEDERLFDDPSCDAVFEYSGGVPRLINLLCDAALVYAFAEQRPTVGVELVRDAATDKQNGGLLPLAKRVDQQESGGPNPARIAAVPRPVTAAAGHLGDGERGVASRSHEPTDASIDAPGDGAREDLILVDYLKARHFELYSKLRTTVRALKKRG
jgi:putative secretion ATPase (PEP-CTERM system associated)